MSKFIALYKCQMCGEMQRLGQPIEGTDEVVEQLTANILFRQNALGNLSDLTPVKDKIPHKCNDGSLGISLFAGFKRTM